MERIKVVIVEDEHEERSAIVDILANVEYITVSGEALSSEEALDLIDTTNPDVALVGAYIPGDGYKLAEKIATSYPEVIIIMIERELKEESMRKAIFTGAKDVLVYPFVPSKLVDSIYRSYQLERKKRHLQRDKIPSSGRKSKEGHIITVFSTKGGVGKTFVATNLAVALTQQNKADVVLVDLDLDFGNATLALNIIPRYTISDIINEIHDLDRDLIESYLIPHRSGIKVLPATARPQMAEFINAEHIELILKILQSAFDYVVLDMPARFHDPVNPAFQLNDLLVLITTPEVATVRNVKACLIALNELNYPKTKIKVLLNKADARNEIKPKDVEATLNHSLYGILPADYRQVPSSLNKGIPIMLLSPRSKVSRGFQELARKIVGAEAEKQSASNAAPET